MTAQRTGEDAAAFSALARGLEARYPELAEVLGSPDIGLDVFYLQALHAHAGSIYERVMRVAGVPAQERKAVVDSLFALQWSLAYVRRHLLRPLTLRFTFLVLQLESSLGERTSVSLGASAFADIDGLARGIEEKLTSFGARNAQKKAEAIAILAGICLWARRRVEEMTRATGTPLEDLHRVSTVAEQMGWWIDEVHSWLHPLAMKLIYGGGGTKDDVIFMGIKMKAEEWQRAKNRVKALRPEDVDPA